MTDMLTREDFATRSQKVLQFSQNLFHSNPDWVTFFREVLGVSGAARKLFPSQPEFIAFENSQEFARIQQMVSALRNRKGANGSVDEPTRVITVRLPESLHEALKAEANDHSTSMNKLCISKLLQVLSQVGNRNQSQRPATQAQPQTTTGGFQHRPNVAPQPQSQPTPMAPAHNNTSFQPQSPNMSPGAAPGSSPAQNPNQNQGFGQRPQFGNQNPGMRSS